MSVGWDQQDEHKPDGSWIRDELRQASERANALPPHARPVITRPIVGKPVANRRPVTAPDFTPAELDTLRRFDQATPDVSSYDLIQSPPLAPTTCDECNGDGVVDAGRFSARHTRDCWQCEGSGEVDCD